MTWKVNGVIDRIVDGKAVILIESHNKEIFFNVEESLLSLKEGYWLNVGLEDNGEISSIKVDYNLTSERADKIQNVMSKLNKRKGSKFKK